MTGGWKGAAMMLAILLLVGTGAVLGVWWSAGHYRPQLDAANDEKGQCAAARGNLEELAKAQGARLGELANQVEQRQARAALDVAQADQAARVDYSGAQRVQQERTAGDQCAAAAAVIDKELGL